MKAFKLNKVRTFLLTCIVSLAAVFGATLSYALAKPVNANAETLSSTEYQTDGASIRVFQKNSDGSFTTTQRKGIRFHVEMGKNYAYNGKAILDLENTNENGSYVVNEGFKTYTLILPSRLLPESGDLTVDTEKVMKLDTSGYWYPDDEGNLESVAYVYDVPLVWYTDEFTFRGIICTVDESGNETVVASTEITDTSKRILAQVAKLAYSDTKAAIDDTTKTYWGSEDNDNKALDEIDKFIPKYEITYKVGETTTTETVVWGEKPQSVPDDIAFDEETLKALDYETKWYNEDTNETVNLTEGLDLEISKLTTPITLTQASALKFRLTGVADYNNFTVDSTLYSGVKLYATLPVGDIYTADEIKNGSERMVALTTDTVKVELQKSGEETTSAFTIQGVWTLMEGKHDGAQMRLVFAFDSGTLEDGDKLIVKADSVFYVSGVMYKLTEDYAIDYTVVSGTEDYGMFLGYLHNSDIKMIENYTETVNGVVREVIRITFYDDLLINSTFKFVYDGTLPAGYEHAVYTQCNDTGEKTEITQGHYYWNEGKHTILELDGYAYHNNDELFGVPGIKIVQNGGYYIFEDAIYSYFTGEEWVVGSEKGTFGTSAFEIIGTNYTTGTEEVRFTTTEETTLTEGSTKTDRWFDAVRQMYVENMSESEPYAVYHTAADGKTVTELTEFIFHGQDDTNASKGYNHIFGIRNFIGKEAGEKVTIIAGTRFWYGSEYFTASEDINFYFRGTDWVVGHDGTADKKITIDDFKGENYEWYEVSTNKLRMVFNSAMFNDAYGELTIESGSVKIDNTAYTNLHYHGDGNNIFEIIGNVTGDVTKTLGTTAFETTLTIEKGTRLWLGKYCLEFDETMEWLYIGGMHDSHALSDNDPTEVSLHTKADWVNANSNTNVTRADVVNVHNYSDSEVRIKLADGILKNTFYGSMVIDTSKGIPVVNGTGFSDTAFSYAEYNDLIAVRGGQYGAELGDYIVIPKGSVWWTTQGSITFTEEIRGVYSGNGWYSGFNTDKELGELSAGNIQQVYKDGDNEIRIKIPKGLTDAYYGPMAVDGQDLNTGAYDITVQKADGTAISSMFAYWYGGASTWTDAEGNTQGYSADHSLIGIRATGIAANLTNGDVLTIRKGAKLIFHTATGTTGAVSNAEGYYTFAEDIVYTYVDGEWKAGNLNATATYEAENATFTDNAENVIIGKEYTFTVTPNSGYTVSKVTINGDEVTLTADNTYTFTAEATNSIVVTTIPGYNVTFSIGENVTVDGIENGAIKAVASNSSLTFTVTAGEGHRIGTVSGATLVSGDAYTATYKVTPTADTEVAITAVKQWTVTAETSGGVSVNTGSITVDDKGSATFTLNVPENATIKANGEVISGTSYTVSNVTADTNVTFTTYYTVTVNAGNSTVSGVTSGSLYESGATISFTVEAKEGYNVTGVTVNGTTNTTYSTTVSGATSIVVSTELKTYTLTLSSSNASVSGDITNDQTQTITHGTEYSFTVSVESGYLISSVTIDEIEKGTGGSYSFTPSGDVSITVTATVMKDADSETIINNAVDVNSTSSSNLTINNGTLVSNDGNSESVAMVLSAEFLKNAKANKCTTLTLHVLADSTSITNTSDYEVKDTNGNLNTNAIGCVVSGQEATITLDLSQYDEQNGTDIVLQITAYRTRIFGGTTETTANFTIDSFKLS